LLFFFFKAEDGIRALIVTGVQTCALPIYGPGLPRGGVETNLWSVLGKKASICGNGFLDPGEQCDDGNTLAGDCCSPTCQFEPAENGRASRRENLESHRGALFDRHKTI